MDGRGDSRGITLHVWHGSVKSGWEGGSGRKRGTAYCRHIHTRMPPVAHAGHGQDEGSGNAKAHACCLGIEWRTEQTNGARDRGANAHHEVNDQPH